MHTIAGIYENDQPQSVQIKSFSDGSYELKVGDNHYRSDSKGTISLPNPIYGSISLKVLFNSESQPITILEDFVNENRVVHQKLNLENVEGVLHIVQREDEARGSNFFSIRNTIFKPTSQFIFDPSWGFIDVDETSNVDSPVYFSATATYDASGKLLTVDVDGSSGQKIGGRYLYRLLAIGTTDLTIESLETLKDRSLNGFRSLLKDDKLVQFLPNPNPIKSSDGKTWELQPYAPDLIESPLEALRFQSWNLFRGEPIGPILFSKTDAEGHVTLTVAGKIYDVKIDDQGKVSLDLRQSGIIPPVSFVTQVKTYSIGDKTVEIVINPKPEDPDYDADFVPWSEAEVQQLSEALDRLVPVVGNFYGAPYESLRFPLFKSLRTVSSFDPRAAHDRMLINIDIFNPEFLLFILVHELGHAFHGKAMILGVPLYLLFEEGMAQAIADLGSFNHHSSPEQIHYEGAIGQREGLPLVNTATYNFGSYFWSKMYFEDPDFFKKFNEQYYEALVEDPSITADQTKLFSLVQSIKPTVEGKPFFEWLDSQGHFNEDYETHLGIDLYIRYGYETFPLVVAYEISHDPSNSIGFIRETNLFLHALPKHQVMLEVYDHEGHLVTADRAFTDEKGITPFYLPPNQYTGRLTLVAKLKDQNGNVTPETRTYQSRLRGLPTVYRIIPNSAAFFGVIKNFNQGTVEVRRVGESEILAQATVINGAFVLHEIPKEVGSFEITFTDPMTGQTLRKIVTKDAAPYYIEL